MNKKTVIKIFVAVLILIVGVVAFFSGINQNSIISWALTKEFKSEINDYDSLEIIDNKSACGKISGNGNGMEFYGAVLVKANSEDDIAKLVADMDDEYDIVGYYVETHKAINVEPIGGHIFLEYESFPNDGSIYYTVYYLTTHKFSTDFDIRAH